MSEYVTFVTSLYARYWIVTFPPRHWNPALSLPKDYISYEF